MIFNEIYSAYYNAVAKIISAIINGETDEKRLDKIVEENAFGESMFSIETPTQPKRQGRQRHSRTQQRRKRLQCNMKYIIYTYLLNKRKNIYLLRIDKKRICIPP